jgi:hypothetical protein
MKYLIIFVCFTLWGCSLGKSISRNFINCQCEIIDIKEIGNSFRFVALNELKDTIYIVSLKNDCRNIVIKQSDSIYLNQIYDFKLSELKPHISAVHLGAAFIVGSDTIMKIPSYNPQKYASENLFKVYFAYNVIGLCKKE